MSTTLKTLFFVYKAKVNSKGLAPLIYRLKYNKQSAQLSTGYFIRPKDWLQEKSQVKNTDPNHKVINQHLKDLELKSYSIFSKMFHEGDVYLSTIIDKLKGQEDEQVSLLQLVKICNHRLQERVGTDLRASSYRRHQITETKLVDFVQSLGNVCRQTKVY